MRTSLFCMLVCVFTSVCSTQAEPAWEKLFPGRQLEIRLADATILIPETLNVEEKYLRLDLKKHLENRPSATRTSWLGATLVECPAKNVLEADKQLVTLMKGWFSKAKWVDDLDKEIMGIEPEGVTVVLDDTEPLHVWILQHWQNTVRLRVGYSCGDGFYQVLPHSKVAVIADEQCKGMLLKLLGNKSH